MGGWEGGSCVPLHINVVVCVNPTDRSTEFKGAVAEGRLGCLTLSEGDVLAAHSFRHFGTCIIIFHLLEYTLSHMEKLLGISFS